MTIESDGVAVAAFALLANLTITLLKNQVVSPEDIREVLDITISSFEMSSLDDESFRHARKLLDGVLAVVLGNPRSR